MMSPRFALALPVAVCLLAAPALPAHAGSINYSKEVTGKNVKKLKDGIEFYARMNAGKGAGGANRASVSQSGRGNSAGIVQSGSGHSATASQNGNGNVVGIVQFGRGTTASSSQTGNGQGRLIVQGNW